jgi:hypothetical protein
MAKLSVTSIGGIRSGGRSGASFTNQVNKQINLILNPPVLPEPEPGEGGGAIAPPAFFKASRPPAPLPTIVPWPENVPGLGVRLVIRSGRAQL